MPSQPHLTLAYFYVPSIVSTLITSKHGYVEIKYWVDPSGNDSLKIQQQVSSRPKYVHVEAT
jgi:hypothetical protein